jgi:TolB protein
VIGASGGTRRLLVPSVPGSALATWSARGVIAFGSTRTDRAHVYSVRPDGTALRTLVRNVADAFPSWSPDGRLLLFQHHDCVRGVCGTAISVVRQNGSGRQRVALVARYGIGRLSVTWSPDSRRVAFERPHEGSFHSDVVVVSVDGSGLRNLTRGTLDGALPAWSPDGRSIAFASSESIYVMNADGRNRRRFVDGGSRPAWKPR